MTAAAIVAIALVSILAFSGPRETVARWTHVDLSGIRIDIVPWLDHNESITEKDLRLGSAISLADAQSSVPFPILTLPGAGPNGVWLKAGNTVTPGAVVTLLYEADPEYPEIGSTGIGIALMQWSEPNGAVFFIKQVAQTEQFEPVRINGSSGFWIIGGRLLTDPGAPDATSRPSANVLIWTDRNGITYRLESELERDAAVRLAESLGAP
ncbi:MAG TPA: hypothetical protein VFQ54_00330 [Thermomicrobiales bacterium]|nr:hypothetical protein [Thermomicrobiales bacterium]